MEFKFAYLKVIVQHFSHYTFRTPPYLYYLSLMNLHFYLLQLLQSCGGARSVIVIVVGNEHGDTSSNPGGNSLHFT